MTEPITTFSSAVARGLSAIKDFPLWMLTAIALSLIVIRSVPELSGEIPQQTRRWITVAATVAVIFAACRFGSVIFSQVKQYRIDKEARRTFHLTPIPYRSFWHPVQQKDRTIVTQIRVELMAKNRTDKILRLLAAYVIKPKISGEILQVMIATGANPYNYEPDSLPPSETMHTTVVIMIRGFPGRLRKNLPDLAAVLALADDEGNEQRVRLTLKPSAPNLIVIDPGAPTASGGPSGDFS
jgi:hypothetical protein